MGNMTIVGGQDATDRALTCSDKCELEGSPTMIFRISVQLRISMRQQMLNYKLEFSETQNLHSASGKDAGTESSENMQMDTGSSDPIEGGPKTGGKLTNVRGSEGPGQGRDDPSHAERSPHATRSGARRRGGRSGGGCAEMSRWRTLIQYRGAACAPSSHIALVSATSALTPLLL